MSAEERRQIIECVGVLESWRGRHAGPLRNANANLRHYVRPFAAIDQDVVSVTQRLKKFSTILDKLGRYPRMQLTRMEDIGGVRAILPTQHAADDVLGGSARTGKSLGIATMCGSRRCPATEPSI
jgi:hypothetical protein